MTTTFYRALLIIFTSCLLLAKVTSLTLLPPTHREQSYEIGWGGREIGRERERKVGLKLLRGFSYYSQGQTWTWIFPVKVQYFHHFINYFWKQTKMDSFCIYSHQELSMMASNLTTCCDSKAKNVLCEDVFSRNKI